MKHDKVQKKKNKFWNVNKSKLGTKFHGQPIYEEKYLKAKVREFDGLITTNFLGNGIP